MKQIASIILCASLLLTVVLVLFGVLYPATPETADPEQPNVTIPNEDITTRNPGTTTNPTTDPITPGPSTPNTNNVPVITLPNIEISSVMTGTYYLVASNLSNAPTVKIQETEGQKRLQFGAWVVLTETKFEGHTYTSTSTGWTSQDGINITLEDDFACISEFLNFVHFPTSIEDANCPITMTCAPKSHIITIEQGSCFIQFQYFASEAAYINAMSTLTTDNVVAIPDTKIS
jgi:hypothetical protein